MSKLLTEGLPGGWAPTGASPLAAAPLRRGAGFRYFGSDADPAPRGYHDFDRGASLKFKKFEPGALSRPPRTGGEMGAFSIENCIENIGFAWFGLIL